MPAHEFKPVTDVAAFCAQVKGMRQEQAFKN